MSKRPVAIDLFSGCGGMTLGFEQAGFDVAIAVEYDPVHMATHEHNFPNSISICKSVVDVKGTELLNLINYKKGEVDVVFGGPPCQGFSLMGKRDDSDERSNLIWEFARVVKEIKPKYFIMENVKGLTVGKSKPILDEFLNHMNSLGYKVSKPVDVLNSANFGVPQSRERMFVVGCLRDYELPYTPSPTHLYKVKDTSDIDLLEPVTVWDAISDLPNIDDYEELLDADYLAKNIKSKSHYSKLMSGVACASDDYSYKRVYDEGYITSSARTVHTEKSIKRFLDTAPGKSEPISRYFKLDYDGLCNTLRAGTPTNKGAFTAPRPIHPEHGRVISVREAARLHSYPDWFRFNHTKWHGFRQIGNSVPPLLAKAVASTVIKSLGVKPIKPRKKIKLGSEDLIYFSNIGASKHFEISNDTVGRRLRHSESPSV
jgi:DNA (cytosine-5)-methyltransferase 1